MNLKLTKPQRDFVFDDSMMTGFIGGIGSGKTYAGAVKALMYAAEHPNTIGAVVAPTYRLLRDATLRVSEDVFGDAIDVKNFSDFRFVLKNGSEILYRTASNPDRLRGPNLHWVWIDEAAYVSRKTFDILLGRLRAPGAPNRLWLTTTPRGFDWIYRLYKEGKLSAHRASTTSNIFISPEYAERLRENYTAEMARQEIDGEFISNEGAVIKQELLVAQQVEPGGDSVRYWDLAVSTGEDADRTASVRMWFDGSRYYVGSLIVLKAPYPAVKERIIETAVREGCRVYIESNATQLGFAQDISRDERMSDIMVHPHRVTGSKLARAQLWVSRLEAGTLVFVDDCDWRVGFAELASFPHGAHDDIVDAISGAWETLTRRKQLVVV
jgi:predicted phage terminase large subunit-like protein